MEKARCNTELYSNLRAPLNNVKPSNFWGSHQNWVTLLNFVQPPSSFCVRIKNIAIPLKNIGIAIVCLENIYYLYTTT